MRMILIPHQDLRLILCMFSLPAVIYSYLPAEQLMEMHGGDMCSQDADCCIACSYLKCVQSYMLLFVACI